MIEILISLLIAIIIIWLIVYLISLLKLPDPVRVAVHVGIAIIVIVWLLRLFGIEI